MSNAAVMSDTANATPRRRGLLAWPADTITGTFSTYFVVAACTL